MTNPADHDPAADQVSFPRLYARTARFTLGEPRNITVTADGAAVLFVRTASGVDRSGELWAFDVEAATELILADPAALLGSGSEELSDAERSRRERSRESGAGIVGYSVDTAGATAVFALSGGLWACDIQAGTARRLPSVEPVIDPRIDPTGRRVAYASTDGLHVVDLDGADWLLVGRDPDDPAEVDVVWGQAEFAAAEEMDRFRGFWWAPDGKSLLVERYDNAPVGTWYIADPAHPDREPAAHRYPAAGTANAEVSLWHVMLDGTRRRVPALDLTFPYLARVSWTDTGAVIQVLSRDQKHDRILRPSFPTAADYAADPTRLPVCEILAERTDGAWIDLMPGLPALTPDGRLLADDAGYETRGTAALAREMEARADSTGNGAAQSSPGTPAGVATSAARASDTHRLTLDGVPLTPPGMQLRAVLHVDENGVLATVSTEPIEQRLVWIGYGGLVQDLSTAAGVTSGAAGGDTVVISSSRLDTIGAQFSVCRGLRDRAGRGVAGRSVATGGTTTSGQAASNTTRAPHQVQAARHPETGHGAQASPSHRR